MDLLNTVNQNYTPVYQQTIYSPIHMKMFHVKFLYQLLVKSKIQYSFNPVSDCVAKGSSKETKLQCGWPYLKFKENCAVKTLGYSFYSVTLFSYFTY